MTFKPQPMGKLLVYPKFWQAVTDHSREWITDGAVLARSDVFSTRTKSQQDARLFRSPVQVKGKLTEARRHTPDGLLVHATDWTAGHWDDDDSCAVLLAGNSLRLVNAAVWSAWLATGCRPVWVNRLNAITWQREIKSRMVVVAVLMSVRPSQGIRFQKVTA